MTTTPQRLRVAVIGLGAIGSTVAAALASGEVKNAQLAGVIVRRPRAAEAAPFTVLSLDDALRHCDLIVECAGVEAVRNEGLRVIESGVTLLVSSVGALVDPDFRERMMMGGPGRCIITTGAMGGLDVLSAAARGGGLSAVSLTTTKSPAALTQPWMSDAERRELTEATGPVTAFRGTVRDAIRRFPRSLNVAVALAIATGLWDELTVTMVADPSAELTTHAVTASGRSGEYTFTMRHRPHPDNPATSGVVPAALLQEIEEFAKHLT